MEERKLGLGLVACKVWKCSLCGETRQDSDDMARHLHDEHNIKSLEIDSTQIYGWVEK